MGGGLRRIVGHEQEVEVGSGDHRRLDHLLELFDQVGPVLHTHQHDGELLDLARLDEGESLEHLIPGAESALHHDECIRVLHQHHLADEEVFEGDLDVEVAFEHFFIRKVMLVKYSYAFVVMQGGFGTGDEMFEALTLIQTGKIQQFPVVLMGVEYWTDLIEQLEQMVEASMISRSDLDLLLVTDDPAEAAAHICNRAVIPFGLADRLRPLRLLGEPARASRNRLMGRRKGPSPA